MGFLPETLLHFKNYDYFFQYGEFIKIRTWNRVVMSGES